MYYLRKIFVLSFFSTGSLAAFDVGVSCDAGRYVCNFTYYISLGQCSQNQQLYTLFVHVPPFECIAQDAQLEVIQALLTELTNCLRDGWEEENVSELK